MVTIMFRHSSGYICTHAMAAYGKSSIQQQHLHIVEAMFTHSSNIHIYVATLDIAKAVLTATFTKQRDTVLHQ